jgi:hypothetical protein
MDQSSGKKIVTHTYERKTDEMEGVLFSWAAEYEVNMRNIKNIVERTISSAHTASNLVNLVAQHMDTRWTLELPLLER